MTKVTKFAANQRIDRIDYILQERCCKEGFTFVDNKAVNVEHILKDGIYLKEQGKTVLANNVI